MVVRVSPGALVVLGCPVAPDGTPRPAALRRLQRTAAAFAASRLPVLASGGRVWGGAVEAVAFRSWLVTRGGVPAASIALECRSLTTAENARFSAEILAARGVHRIGLVTCDWHLPRAMREFGRAGLVVVPLPATSPPRGVLGDWVRRLRERGASRLDAWCTWGWEGT
jgi:uncharacterized SAM-binding protein YcdF (DUF218 family)